MSVIITIIKPPAVPSPLITVARTVTLMSGNLTVKVSYKKPLSGVLTSFTGLLNRRTAKNLSGSIPATMTGTVSPIKQTTLKSINIDGTLSTMFGTVTRQLSKLQSMTGVLTSVTGTVHKITTKRVEGAITPSHTLNAWLSASPVLQGQVQLNGMLSNEVQVPLAGSVDLAGELFTGDTESYDGNCSPVGSLSMMVAKNLDGSFNSSGLISKNINYNIAGTCEPSGDLTSVFFDEDITLTGNITFTKQLSLGIIYDETWRPPFTGRANKYNFTIEQGTRFERRFRWMHDDGVTPYTLDRFTLTMQIRAYAGANELIASSTDGSITISTEAGGYFTIMIGEEITRGFDFTRAVYNIEAGYQTTNIVRLIEGDIRLSKDPNISTYDYVQSIDGCCGTIRGSLLTSRLYYANLTGNITSSGLLQAPPPLTLTGEIAGNRIYGDLHVVLQPAALTGEITSTGEVAKLISMQCLGETGAVTGDITWINPYEFSGELDDLSGEVTTESLFLCELAGTVEMTGS